jgi:hypothetical protein
MDLNQLTNESNVEAPFRESHLGAQALDHFAITANAWVACGGVVRVSGGRSFAHSHAWRSYINYEDSSFQVKGKLNSDLSASSSFPISLASIGHG